MLGHFLNAFFFDLRKKCCLLPRFRNLPAFPSSYLNSYKLITYKHRCTVVGNPGGGGPWFFLENSFEGGTWGCEKIRGGGRVLLHFDVEVFQKSL